MAIGSPTVGRPSSGEKVTGRVDLTGRRDITTILLQTTTTTNNDSDNEATRKKTREKTTWKQRQKGALGNKKSKRSK